MTKYQFSPSLRLPCPVCGCRSREAIRLNRVCVGITTYPPPDSRFYGDATSFGLASLVIDDEDQTPIVCCSFGGDYTLEEAQKRAANYTAEQVRAYDADGRAFADNYDDDHGPPDSDPYDREPPMY